MQLVFKELAVIIRSIILKIWKGNSIAAWCNLRGMYRIVRFNGEQQLYFRTYLSKVPSMIVESFITSERSQIRQLIVASYIYII